MLNKPDIDTGAAHASIKEKVHPLARHAKQCSIEYLQIRYVLGEFDCLQDIAIAEKSFSLCEQLLYAARDANNNEPKKTLEISKPHTLSQHKGAIYCFQL